MQAHVGDRFTASLLCFGLKSYDNGLANVFQSILDGFALTVATLQNRTADPIAARDIFLNNNGVLASAMMDCSMELGVFHMEII